jgi:two-component system chemotaxis response regulator CheY
MGADAGRRHRSGNKKMRKELLVIDDTNLHQSIVSRIATQAGFATTGANSVGEAARLLRGRCFDCITLDLSLGEESGVEILQLLAELRCRTPVIVISGSENSVRDKTVRIENFLNLNLGPPIPKPIDLAALRNTLARIAEDTQRQKLATPAGW